MQKSLTLQLVLTFKELAMDEILDLVFWFLVGAVIARLGILYLEHRLSSKIEEVEKLKQKISKLIHPVKVEKHGDMIYWFDAETDQFLAQGFTRDQIVEHLKQRFKGHVFLLDEENEKGILTGPDYKVMQHLSVNEISHILEQ